MEAVNLIASFLPGKQSLIELLLLLGRELKLGRDLWCDVLRGALASDGLPYGALVDWLASCWLLTNGLLVLIRRLPVVGIILRRLSVSVWRLVRISVLLSVLRSLLALLVGIGVLSELSKCDSCGGMGK